MTELQNKVEELSTELAATKESLEALNLNHSIQLESTQSAHETALANLREEGQAEKDAIRQEHEVSSSAGFLGPSSALAS